MRLKNHTHFCLSHLNLVSSLNKPPNDLVTNYDFEWNNCRDLGSEILIIETNNNIPTVHAESSKFASPLFD